MYMLVFVTLVIALIGTYAQIYTKQAARMFSQQSGIAATMLGWNATAVSLVNNLVPLASITTTGCSLTNFAPYTGTPTLSPCVRTAQNIYVGNTNVYSVPVCSKTQGAPCWTDVPPGYQKTAYPFYSIAFAGTVTPIQYYVLTFVPPPVTSGQDLTGLDLLCLPGVAVGGFTACPANQKQLATTFSDLYRQMRRSNSASPLYYGIVNSSHNLITPTVTFGDLATPQALTYPVPTSVPTGSIGIITQVAICSTC